MQHYFTMAILFIICIFVLFLIITVWSIIHIYKTKQVPKSLSAFAKIAQSRILPLIYGVFELLQRDKNKVRTFFVNFNNIVVKSSNCKYKPDDILIMLPHCLQNSKCEFKVTNNIANCRKCLKCNIGDIKEISEKYKINSVQVAIGGTAARNVVAKVSPKLIIAVACERDLASGIADVRKIPVIGLFNSRPNGPCVDTMVDISELTKTIDGCLLK